MRRSIARTEFRVAEGKDRGVRPSELGLASVPFPKQTDPDGPMAWELLDRPGAEPERFSLNGEAAIGLLKEAVKQAKEKRLSWPEEPLVLKPSAELVKLVRLSQIEAAKRTGESGETG